MEGPAPALVLPLGAASAAPHGLVGGKARGFATIFAAGLPAPEGFVLTTAAYRAAGGGAAPPARVPRGLEAAIAAALEPLGDAPVAVRSSADGEDGDGASHAGQFATVLGARGAREVADAVLECWASAGGARAVAYRGRDGAAAARPPLMAVLVQRLVGPAAAGVVMTADPVTGDRDVLVVNASWGLGEAVVSGIVTPDDYRLARADGALRSATIGLKDVMLVPAPAGGLDERPVPAALREAPALGAAALDAVRRGALACEAVAGRPVDCEFCLADGGVVWLQCRPVTALPPAPTTVGAHDDQRGTLGPLPGRMAVG
ncbi:PEP/pyruvate-binding domain-containing protein [Miltoncostaea marina]|uniref:PEP/pyruvate-binding domain-containing protein n=1 Tax=Miltoncostaea marina TaxID=2843215 RepID=UPI001C3C218C|nr:PEP/pyruvate-binding domain-containing protein [Miltoncostaea marina]